MLPASEPASGSVSPNAPSLRAAQQLRQPLLLLLLGAEQVDRLRASDVCAHIVIATEESTRVSSSTASA